MGFLTKSLAFYSSNIKSYTAFPYEIDWDLDISTVHDYMYCDEFLLG